MVLEWIVMTGHKPQALEFTIVVTLQHYLRLPVETEENRLKL
jgi:hypothetical protein